MIKPNRTIGQFLPYSHHVTPEIIKLTSGDYATFFHVDGIDLQTAMPGYREAAKNQLAHLIKSFKQCDIWDHAIRRKTILRDASNFENEACRVYNKSYIESFDGAMLTEHYVSIVFRTGATKLDKTLNRVGPKTKDQARTDEAQAIIDLTDIGDRLLSGLSEYGIRKLTCHGKFSEPRSFLHALATWEWAPQRIPAKPLRLCLANGTTRIGNAALELQQPTHSRFGMCVELDDYPDDTEQDEFGALLCEDYEFVITQSFCPIDKQDGLKAMDRQLAHLISTQDKSSTQIRQIADEGGALDQLASDQFIVGEYSFHMMIWSRPVDNLDRSGETLAAAMNDVRKNVKSAYSLLTELGYAPAMTSLASDAAYFAMFPGMKQPRPAVHLLTSLNYASLACKTGFAHGKRRGNPWGPCLTYMQSASRYPYALNLHVEEDSSDRRGQDDPGSTFMSGMTGSGKTVLAQHFMAQAGKYNATRLLIDKDHSGKRAIEARDGLYLGVEFGKSSGMAPFQWPDTPSHRLFLSTMVGRLAQGMNRQEETDVANGIQTVMELKRQHRSLSALLQNLPDSGEANSLNERLAKWCRDDGYNRCGEYWWVLDNERDSFDLTGKDIGIDVTDVIDDEVVSEPMTMMILEKAISLMDGNPFMLGLEEFWQLLDHPAFEGFAKNQLKTIRKKNGLVLMMTQSPSDALQSKIARTVREQCATNIFLPNPDATEEDYIEGFGLSDVEFYQLRELGLHSHKFLLKQGRHRSVFLQFNLNGVKGTEVVGR